MERNQILRIAETARLQLLATTSTSVICSWGVEKFFAMQYNGMGALGIKLNGRLFTGNAIIALNEASDLYEVYLMNENGAKCVSSEVFCDQIGNIIDIAVERGTDEKEYHAFIERERQRLLKYF